MKALIDLGQADLADAKLLVHGSPIWSDVREHDEEFHRKLEETYRRLEEEEKKGFTWNPDSE